MPLNRTNFNLLVDDDGSNLVGTIWDKAHIKDVILDPVDAALIDPASMALYTLLLPTTTGAVTNWAPGLAGHTVLFWNGAADLTINSIAGGVSGQIVTIKNIHTTTKILLTHNIGGTAGLFNRATSAATPIGPSGAATYQYYPGVGWHLIAHDQGAWITPPFSAAEFAPEVGTWTVSAGNVSYRKYKLQGSTLFYKLGLTGTSLSNVNGILATKIPGGFTGRLGEPVSLMRARNAPAAYLVGAVTVSNTAGTTWLNLNAQIDGTAWTVSTNQTGLDLSIVLEVI